MAAALGISVYIRIKRRDRKIKLSDLFVDHVIVFSVVVRMEWQMKFNMGALF